MNQTLRKKLVELLIKFKHFKPLDMARYAKEHTDFYGAFYNNVNMDCFEELPVLTKYHLVGVDPYKLLNRKFEKEVFLYGETSGSSGSPTPVFMTKKDFNGLTMLNAISPYAPLIHAVLKENRTAVNGLTFGFTIAGLSFGNLLQNCGAAVAQLGSRSTIAMPERTAATIAKLGPGIISATPLDFMAWMAIIQKDHPEKYGKVFNKIKILMSSAEPCATSRMKRIEEHFGIRHINVYASVDGFVAIPCPCGEMHLIENLHHIELYDNNMNHLGRSGLGRLCFTSLVRKTTPMVKFLLDDLVTIKESQCPYGYKRSIKPHGRYELSMEIGDRTWGNLDFEETIYNYGLFMDYKVEVHSDFVSIDLEEYPDVSKKYDLGGLKNEISEHTGMKCFITMHSFGTLTSYRNVRQSKSVIKVLDCREESRQVKPQIL